MTENKLECSSLKCDLTGPPIMYGLVIPTRIRQPTNYDDSCTSQQSEQGAEHHLVGVYEAVEGVAPLHITNWRSSC